MKAVIDRIEGDMAVLLIGDSEQRMEVVRKMLPKKATEGQWLKVEMTAGEITHIEIDAEETARTKERIAEKLASLRRGDHLAKDNK
jgi:hypothetical protein